MQAEQEAGSGPWWKRAAADVNKIATRAPPPPPPRKDPPIAPDMQSGFRFSSHPFESSSPRCALNSTPPRGEDTTR